MKKIKLTRGKYALVDDDDFEYLNQWNWCANLSGYAERAIQISNIGGKKKYKHFYMHREIMKTPKGMQTDHIDGNGFNNQKENLRNCTQIQNSRNMRKHKKSTSKFKGVSWDKLVKKWRVQIKDEKTTRYIGIFDNELEAAKTYDKAAKKYHGEFANLNFPKKKRS